MAVSVLGNSSSSSSSTSTAAAAVPDLAGLRTFVLNLRRRPDRRSHVEALCQTLGLRYEIVEALDGTALHSRPGTKMHAIDAITFELSWPSDPAQDPAWVTAPSSAECNSALRADGELLSAKVRIKPDREPPERWTVLSCLLGHDHILSRMEEEDLEFALILEDDSMPNYSLVEGRSEGARKRRQKWQVEPPAGEVWKAIQARYKDGALWVSKQAEASWRLLYLGGVLGFMNKGEGIEGLKENIPDTSYSDLLVRANQTMQAHAYLIHRRAVASVRKYLMEGYAADAALARSMKDWASEGCWRFKPCLLRQPPGGYLRDSNIVLDHDGQCRVKRRRDRLSTGLPGVKENQVTAAHHDTPADHDGHCRVKRRCAQVAAILPSVHEDQVSAARPHTPIAPSTTAATWWCCDVPGCTFVLYQGVKYKYQKKHSHKKMHQRNAPRKEEASSLPQSCSEAGPLALDNFKQSWAPSGICLEVAPAKPSRSVTSEEYSRMSEESSSSTTSNVDEHRAASSSFDAGRQSPSSSQPEYQVVCCARCTMENSASDTHCVACWAPLAPASGVESWICKVCTLENSPGSSQCHTCLSPLSAPLKGWRCPACTFENAASLPDCEMCGWTLRRPEELSKSADEESAIPVEDSPVVVVCERCKRELCVHEEVCKACGPSRSELWTCVKCTLENPRSCLTCEACTADAPAWITSSVRRIA